ncbi:MAG: hypothetical protein JW864_13435, partial [Spirochaetes bacterium]|nr:hypothetical protein [Spirochaetota bacterium]
MKVSAFEQSKRISLAVIACILFMIIPLSNDSMFGQVQFRKYEDDRKGLERYIEGAKDAQSLEQWDNIVQSGLESMEADWERDAEIKIERALLNEEAVNITALEQQRQEALAEWETRVQAKIAEEKGKWYARRQNIIYGDLDKNALRGILEQADAAAEAIENRDDKITSWDAVVNQGKEELAADWEISLDTMLQNARNNSFNLDQESAAYFEQEILKIEQEVKDLFRLDKNTIIYSERNELIKELYDDSNSLRSISEANSAEELTERILNETEEQLKSDEEAILDPGIGEYDGTGRIDFSDLGDNWEEEIRRLMDAGMERWKAAQDRLFEGMLLWKENAEIAYEEGNKKWDEAYRKLIEAKENWVNRLTEDINFAMNEWRNNQETLNENIEQARENFNTYAETVNRQWNSHSAALSNMAISGASAYGTAMDNIEWLNDMLDFYQNKGTYPVTEVITNSGINPSNLNSINLSGQEYELLNTVKNSYLRQFVDYVYSSNVMPSLYVPLLSFAKTGITKIEVTPTLLSYNRIGDSENFTETYSLKFSAEYSYNYTYYPNTGNNYTLPPPIIKNDTATYETTYQFTTSETDYSETSYVFYRNELDRWTDILNNFNEIVLAAESTMHSGNMTGIDANGNPVDGPAFLRNSQGLYGLRYSENGELESDTYLMTTAELNYELARRNMEYWENRLDIADAVRKYAFPDENYENGNDYVNNGKLEDAATTENRMEQMREAAYGVNGAKQAYDNSLLEVESIVERLNYIKGINNGDYGTFSTDYPELGINGYEDTIEGLTEQLAVSKGELETAKQNYNALLRSIAILENLSDEEDGLNYLMNEMIEAERNLVEAENTLRTAELTYFSELRQSEIIDDLGEFSALFTEVYNSRNETETRFNAYRSIVAGEETDSNLATWVQELEANRNEIWGMEAGTMSAELNTLYSEWTNASNTEKAARREQLTNFIRNEYNTFDISVNAADEIIQLMLDKNFDTDAFLQTSFPDLFRNSVIQDYANFATINLNALTHIRNTIDELAAIPEDITYNNIINHLESELNGLNYSYGTDNTQFITATAAYKWAAGTLANVNESLYEAIIDSETSKAAAIADYYSNYSSFDFDDVNSLANNGNEHAKAVMTEYYNPGASITCINEIKKYDISVTRAENIFSVKYQFVTENQSFLLNANEELKHDYMTGLLTYLDIEALDADYINELDDESMTNLVDKLNEYISITKHTPRAVADLLDLINSYNKKLKEYMFIEENAGDNDLKASTLQESRNSNEALEFIIDAAYNIDTGNMEDSIRNIMTVFDDLDQEVQAYLPLDFLERMENLRVILNEYDSSRLAYDFISPANTMSLDDFVNTKCISCEDGQRETLRQFLLPFRERLIFYDSPVSGSLNTYLENRNADENFSNETYDRIRHSIMVDTFIAILSANIPEYGLLNDEFEEFSKYFHFEEYITGNNLADQYNSILENDRDAFITDIVNNYTGMPSDYIDGDNIDGYAGFAAEYFEGRISSEAYLPPEAQFFTAYNDYYSGIFTNGALLNDESDIAAYIEEHYTSLGFDTAVDSALREYIDALNSIDDYYGSELQGYIAGLNTDAGREAFENYYYVTARYGIDTLSPGWDMMNAGISAEIYSNIYLNMGLLEDHFNEFFQNMDSFIDDMSATVAEKAELADFANSLFNYNTNPGDFKSFRNFMLADNQLTPIVNGTKDDDNTINIHSNDYFLSDDYRDTYIDDLVHTFIFQKADSNNSMLESMKIDVMNEIAYRLEFITAITGTVTIENDNANDPRSISTYIDAASLFINSSNPNINKDQMLSEINSGVNAATVLLGSESLDMTALRSEIDNTSSLVASYKKMVLNKGESFQYMNTDNRAEELKKDLEPLSGIMRQAQTEYNSIYERLRTAQEAYNAGNNEYIAQMNTIARNYATFKQAEHDYEKAYAVWEYANTPYLKEAYQYAGESGDGELAGMDGNSIIANLDELDAPDAKENYGNILARYEAERSVFETLEAAWQNQETVEDLRSNAGYMEFRDALLQKSQSFIRVNRADAVMDKELEALKQEIEIAKSEYIETKQIALGRDTETDVTGANENVPTKTEAEINELIDQILTRMLPAGNKNAAENGLKEYVDRFVLFEVLSTKLAETDEDDQAKAEEAMNEAAERLANFKPVGNTYSDYNAYMALVYAYNNAARTYNNMVSKHNNLTANYASFKVTNEDIFNDMESMRDYNLKYQADIVQDLMQPANHNSFYLDSSSKLGYLRNSTRYPLTRWIDGWQIYNYSTNGIVKIHYEKKYNKDRTHNFSCDYRDLFDLAIEKCNGFEEAYDDMLEKFMDVWRAREKVNFLTNKLKALDQVRNLSQVKAVLGKAKYALTAEDMANIYDNTLDTNNSTPATGDDFSVTNESINITSVRREERRTDINGYEVRAAVNTNNGRIYIRDMNGRTIETVTLDSSYILRDINSNDIMYKADDNIDSLVNGGQYYLSDYVYSVSEAAHIMSENYRDQRDNLKQDYFEAGLGHDSTIVLRDQEELYWDILNYAAEWMPSWTETVPAEGKLIALDTDHDGYVTISDSETKPRAYESYKETLSELVYNGQSTSIDDRIVHELIEQNTSFQEQAWQQQQEKFNERQARWIEIVSFIKNRGTRDWNNRMVRFLNDWKKWSINARLAIEEGEKEWVNTVIDYSNRRAEWQQEMAGISSEESFRNIYYNLQNKLTGYLNNLGSILPQGIDLGIDPDIILSETMRDLPEADLGVLMNTMKTTDTTAGFAEFLNLNLSFDLQKNYEKMMGTYEESLTVMQNLQMTEVLAKILENFEKQLTEANDGVFEQVNSDIRWGDPFYDAPFNRNEGQNKWSIKYVTEYSYVNGTKYKTMHFDDYRKYENSTVYLKRIKGIDGEIDFADPNTFRNIDADELEIFVGLEVDHLTKVIDDVFKNGDPDNTDESTGENEDDGLFTKHVKQQFKKLGDDFGEGYSRWAEGEALRDTDAFSRSIVGRSGPSPRLVVQTAATVVATVYGGPAAGVGVTAAFASLDAAQGKITWEQMIMQVAISAAASYAGGAATAGTGNQLMGAVASQAVNTAASGLEYNPDGSIGWDNDKFKAGLKSGAINIAMSYAMSEISIGEFNLNSTDNAWMKSSLTSFINAGIDTDNGSWWKIGWNDTGDALASGIASGAASYFSNRIALEQEPAKDNYNNINSGAEQTDYTGAFTWNDYSNKLVYNTVNSGLLSMYNVAAHDMSWDEAFQSTGFWEGMVYNHTDIGGYFGTKAIQQTDMYKEYQAAQEKARKE